MMQRLHKIFQKKLVYNYSTSLVKVYNKDQYSKAKLQEIVNDCKFIEELPPVVSQQTCHIFYDCFFPVKKNYHRIVPQIQALIKNQGDTLTGDSRQNLSSCLIQNQNSKEIFTADEVYNRIINVVDFLDLGNFGFLTGDINPQTFKIVETGLQSFIDRDNLNQEEINTSLKKNIFCGNLQFRLPLQGIKSPDLENPRNLFERQLVLEEESNDIAVERFQEVFNSLHKMSKAQNLHAAQKCIVDWFPSLCREIQKEQESCIIDHKGVTDRQIYGEFLIGMQSEKLAVIALTELLKELINTSVRYHKEDDKSYMKKLQSNQISLIALTKEVAQQINKQHIYEKEKKLFKEKQRQYMKDGDPKVGAKKFMKTLKIEENRLRDQISSRYYRSKTFEIPMEVQLKISQLLIFLMKETIRVTNINGLQVPLLIQSYKLINTKQQTLLNVNEAFLEQIVMEIQKDNSLFLHLNRSLPMIYQPAPWEDPEVGGYYMRPTNLIRQNESCSEAPKYADLTQLYGILDTISRVPWQINQRVLDIVNKVWEQGGGYAEIPIQVDNPNEIVHEFQIKEAKSREEKLTLQKKLEKQRNNHSMRCDFSLKLSVAQAFSKVNRIYFPHNLDFRGRLYPVPPHLNHMGADLGRGLLQFADAKPLGERGFYWLKVHIANKMGKDKLSLPDRIAYVDSNIDLILRCAHDPLAHKEWSQFESGWQSLAGMLDLAQALKLPDPRKYVSQIHVHQDGSCNGLQHYAALGRDSDGASQVNLRHSDKPGDVYSHVAGMVERQVGIDAQDSSSKFHALATKLVGHIKRKVVKQTVMTSVYGVTFIGAREQIAKQLKEHKFLDEDELEQYNASYYLAQVTLGAIKDLFEGAHRIKQWLIECAEIIGSLDQPVSWITPVGLPVVQPYRSHSQYDTVQTVMQRITVQQSALDLPIQKQKQKSAFPPNFIHSLDSTHLMYTAVECEKEKITFAAVHDSYWTHPCDVDRLNVLLREQFVRLHSQPLLEELRQSFVMRYPEVDFPSIPERGSFDLENVKQSVYFFA